MKSPVQNLYGRFHWSILSVQRDWDWCGQLPIHPEPSNEFPRTDFVREFPLAMWWFIPHTWIVYDPGKDRDR